MKKIIIVALAVLIGISSIGAYEVFKPKLTIEETQALNSLPDGKFFGVDIKSLPIDKQKKILDMDIKVKNQLATTAQVQQQTPPNLVVESIKCENDGYMGDVVGVIKNKDNVNYSYVELDINEYDKDGNQVGSIMTNTNNLEANGTWSYKGYMTSDNVTQVKVFKLIGTKDTNS